MKGFHKLRIECDDPMGYSAHVYLDDHELYLRSLHLDIGANEINRLTIDLDVDHIDVSAEALAMLQAHVTTEPPARTVTRGDGG